MSEWVSVNFSDVLVDESISYGIVQPGSHTDVDSVPIVRVNNIKNGYIKTDDVLRVSSAIEKKYQRTRLSGGELLITVVGNVGECAIVPKELEGWNVARAVSVAKIKETYDTRFIKYCFKSEDVKFQMYGNTNDTVQPTLNLSSLKALVLSIPSSVIEQNAIASVLGNLDDKIDLLNRQNQTLESIAQTLFRQWFIEEAGDWKQKKLSDYAEHLKINIRPASNPNQIYEHYSLPAFDNGLSPLHEPGSSILSNKYRINQWTILVSKLNPRFPRVWPIGGSVGENAICSTEFQVFKPKDNNLFGFLNCFLKSQKASDELQMCASGTSGSHQRVKPGDILNLAISSPSNKYLEDFSGMVMPGIRKTIKNLEQIRTLEKLRDTLLPKLMSGEVRVSV